MAIAYVNGACQSSGAASGATYALTGQNHTTGNSVVVFAQAFGSYPTGVSDTEGNTYAQVGSIETGQGCWIASNITGNASNTVTVTFESSATFRAMGVAQYSGLATSSPADASAAFIQTSTGTTHASGSTGTTTQADEVVVGWWIAWDTPWTLSAGTNTNLRSQSSSGDCAIGDRIVSSTGSYVVTLNSSSATSYGVIAKTFKMASSGSIAPLAMANYRMRTA